MTPPNSTPPRAALNLAQFAAAPADWPVDAVEVGRVSGAYGLKGMIKVNPQSDDCAALLKSATWWLEHGLIKTQRLMLATRGRKVHAGGVVAAADGVLDRNLAEMFRGATVFVSRAEFPAAKNGEYYWVDLIGLAVINKQGVNLGVVLGLLDNGAQSILRVGSASAKQQTPERLIPFVEQFVGEVSFETRTIAVDWDEDF